MRSSVTLAPLRRIQGVKHYDYTFSFVKYPLGTVPGITSPKNEISNLKKKSPTVSTSNRRKLNRMTEPYARESSPDDLSRMDQGKSASVEGWSRAKETHRHPGNLSLSSNKQPLECRPVENWAISVFPPFLTVSLRFLLWTSAHTRLVEYCLLVAPWNKFHMRWENHLKLRTDQADQQATGLRLPDSNIRETFNYTVMVTLPRESQSNQQTPRHKSIIMEANKTTSSTFVCSRFFFAAPWCLISLTGDSLTPLGGWSCAADWLPELSDDRQPKSKQIWNWYSDQLCVYVSRVRWICGFEGNYG